MAKYLCKNYGSCAKADAREAIELPPGAELVCPECGFNKLDATEIGDGGDNKRWVYVAAAVGVAAVIGGGAWYWMTIPSGTVKTGNSGVAVATVSNAQPPIGAVPDAKALEAQKKDADKKITEAGGAGASTAQAAVIAQEYVKAAIPLMQSGKWDEANAQLLKAKTENPEEPLVYYNQAIVHLKQGRQREAIAALETAFQKGFKDFVALEGDADLKPLLDQPDAKAMLVKYKGK